MPTSTATSVRERCALLAVLETSKCTLRGNCYLVHESFEHHVGVEELPLALHKLVADCRAASWTTSGRRSRRRNGMWEHFDGILA